MSDLLYFVEKILLLITDIILTDTELVTYLCLIGIAALVILKFGKVMKKAHTTTEQVFPEIDRLKKVETKTKTDEWGYFWSALSKIIFVMAVVLIIMKIR